MGQILSNVFCSTTAPAIHNQDSSIPTVSPNPPVWRGQARELPLGPTLDHNHAFGGKCSEFPKPKNAQLRVIIQLFVEVAVRERKRCTIKPKRMAGPRAGRTPMQDIDEARLIFFAKNIAVLESIKIRGGIKRAFEEWIANEEADDSEEDIDLPFLSPAKDIRLRVQELLDDFTNSPVPDMADLLAMAT